MGFSTFLRWVGAGVLGLWLVGPTAAGFAAMATLVLCACSLGAALDALSQRLDWQALGYLVVALVYNPIVPLAGPSLLAALYLMAPRLRKKEPRFA